MTQRVIKYRAYDMHFEEMCYVTSMFWPAKKKNGFDIVEGHGVTGTPYRDITITEINQLMQFTGLLDKHGKEIYDKDILRFVGGTCNVMPCGNYGEHHTTGTLLIVKWLQSGWTLSPIRLIDADTPNIVGHVGNYDFWNHHRSFERLGDLYTTPELVDPKMIEHGPKVEGLKSNG